MSVPPIPFPCPEERFYYSKTCARGTWPSRCGRTTSSTRPPRLPSWRKNKSVVPKNRPFSGSFLFSSFQCSQQMLYFKVCLRLDSNDRPLVSESTTLPTEPQPLNKSEFFHHFIWHTLGTFYQMSWRNWKYLKLLLLCLMIFKLKCVPSFGTRL